MTADRPISLGQSMLSEYFGRNAPLGLSNFTHALQKRLLESIADQGFQFGCPLGSLLHKAVRADNAGQSAAIRVV